MAGVLFAGNAAAVDLTATTPAAGRYAKEIKTVSSPAASATLLAASAGTQITWLSGYAYSPNEVRYVRVEAAPHVRFQGFVPTATGGTGALTPGAVNGVGTNVVTFSITAGAAGAGSDVRITLPAAVRVTSIANSDVSVSLYDTPSQAQAGGETGRIAGGSFAGPYLSFVDSLRLLATGANTATASVNANPSFTRFVGTAPADLTQTLTATLELTTTGSSAPLKADGTAIGPADLLDLTESTVSIEGDFSFVASSGTSPFDATARGRVQGFGGAADALSASAAVFELGGALTGPFSVSKLAGTTWNPVIAASTYTAKLNGVAANPLIYNLPVVASTSVGAIVRDGTELQAPLAQVPSGWISRMALTNTGNVARSYTINVMGETGNIIETDNVTGTVPANGTVVVDLNTVMKSFSNPDNPRGTLNVSIAGPNNQIQGLYQIVNPTSGSISNHVMVRPASN